MCYNISESEKFEYLEKLELKSISLSENMTWKLYNDPDSYIRSRLAQALVNYHNELSEKVLICMLEDKDEIVKANACDSLGYSNSRKTLEKLISILQKDKYLVRGYALLSIADIIIDNNYFEYIPKVKSSMDHEKSKYVLLNYYGFLYRLGEESYLLKIAESLNAVKYIDRCHAVNLLYSVSQEKNYLTIIEILENRLTIEKTFAVKSTIQRAIKNLESVNHN